MFSVDVNTQTRCAWLPTSAGPSCIHLSSSYIREPSTGVLQPALVLQLEGMQLEELVAMARASAAWEHTEPEGALPDQEMQLQQQHLWRTLEQADASTRGLGQAGLESSSPVLAAAQGQAGDRQHSGSEEQVRQRHINAGRLWQKSFLCETVFVPASA